MTNPSFELSMPDRATTRGNTLSGQAPLPGYSLFLLMWCVLAIIGIYQSAQFLFGPAVIESGDFAVNALDIFRSRHFEALYGNYSRWQINHPGPAFFYMYGWGEWLFLDLLHLVKSPHQAHVLTSIIMQAGFIACGLAILARTAHSRSVGLVAFAVAMLVFPFTLNALISIWPPNVLFGPYVLLLCAGTAVALGSVRLIPALTLACAFLCHGHLAQPLVCLPIAGVALLLCGARLRKRPPGSRLVLKEIRTPIALSTLIVAVFLLPIAIDLTQCPECNPVRIAHYLHMKTDTLPRWRQAINYVFGFGKFDHQPETSLDGARKIPIFTMTVSLGLAFLALQALLFSFTRKLALSRGVADAHKTFQTAFAFCVFAIFLSIVWAHHITGPLYEFNSFYIYAIIFIDLTILASFMGLLAFDAKASRIVLVPCLIIGCIAISRSSDWTPLSANYTYPDTPALQQAMASVKAENILDPSGGADQWERAATAAIILMRNGATYYSVPSWRFMFGWHTALSEQQLLNDSAKIDIWNFKANASGNRFTDEAYISTLCRSGRLEKILDLPEATALSGLRSNCDIVVINLSESGPDGAWTTGKAALLQFRSRETSGVVHLELGVAPYLAPDKGLKQQRATLYVNGTQVSEQSIAGTGVLSANIPAQVWNSSKTTSVGLILPDARSPESLGESADSRELALSIKSIRVDYAADDSKL